MNFKFYPLSPIFGNLSNSPHVKTQLHLLQIIPLSRIELRFPHEKHGGFNMRWKFSFILHGKRFRSKNSRLLPEGCFLPIYPFLQYFTPFQSAYHTYTHWQNFRLFRFASEYIFNPFGYRRDFFPDKKHFHNFICVLFSPEPVPDIAVMAAELLRLGRTFKFLSAKHTLILVKR